ncbi:hypothetical protein PRIPAC_81169, partial [Pristionchus pacificus]|uniref:G protein-coupled receptor n=1 Tax=Pristionchus pacificus TaxID=54126 RepID=A0A2A6CK25_PRIPA
YALCSLIVYYQIYNTDLRTQMSICSLINSINQFRTTHVQITIFVLELTSLIAFWVLNRYNKRMIMRVIGMSLKARYQLDENARSLRTILPTIIMHTICFFIPNVVALLLFLILSPSKPQVVVID